MESRTPNGFTFIEILVSVTLLLLLSGLLVAGYNRFNDSQVVAQAAATVQNNFRAIRTDAASGIKPEGCGTLVGYRVAFPTSASYTATAVCQTAGGQEELGIPDTYVLPTGVTFTPLPQTFLFYPLERGVSVTQVIELRSDTNVARLSVLSSGIVDDVP